MLAKHGQNDALHNFILTGEYQARVWDYIADFKQVIKANKKERIKLVEKLLSKWYVSRQDEYWYGNHRMEDRLLYFGYWAGDVAALVKILKIPDDTFKDQKYYPHDLVHFGA